MIQIIFHTTLMTSLNVRMLSMIQTNADQLFPHDPHPHPHYIHDFDVGATPTYSPSPTQPHTLSSLLPIQNVSLNFTLA